MNASKVEFSFGVGKFVMLLDVSCCGSTILFSTCSRGPSLTAKVKFRDPTNPINLKSHGVSRFGRVSNTHPSFSGLREKQLSNKWVRKKKKQLKDRKRWWRPSLFVFNEHYRTLDEEQSSLFLLFFVIFFYLRHIVYNHKSYNLHFNSEKHKKRENL